MLTIGAKILCVMDENGGTKWMKCISIPCNCTLNQSAVDNDEKKQRGGDKFLLKCTLSAACFSNFSIYEIRASLSSIFWPNQDTHSLGDEYKSWRESEIHYQSSIATCHRFIL